MIFGGKVFPVSKNVRDRLAEITEKKNQCPKQSEKDKKDSNEIMLLSNDREPSNMLDEEIIRKQIDEATKQDKKTLVINAASPAKLHTEYKT